MSMKLQFLGANRQVTGSRYLLSVAGLNIMIDCGMFQERKHQDRNWTPPPVNPDEVDYLLLTHAHLDHSGLIPKFVKHGYRGPVYSTHPSVALAKVVMEDAARIQEEDAKYKKKRHKKSGHKPPRPVEPLYTTEDADQAIKLLRTVAYDKPLVLNEDVRVYYRDAGHILGSAMLDIRIRQNGTERRIVFSGDVGQTNRALMNDPDTVERADYLVLESTYGGRNHQEQKVPDHAEQPIDDPLTQCQPLQPLELVFADIINRTVERGGNVVIPTFAIDRAQELIWHIGRLMRTKRIPTMQVYLDSPMAVDATRIYKTYRYLLDEDTQCAIARGDNPFAFPTMHLVRKTAESKNINNHKKPCIIMAGSGMCTGGRIKHHLRQNIEREASTILFVGYQAYGTLGRRILEGESPVRIHGRTYDLRAQVEKLNGLSAHGDQEDLLNWAAALSEKPSHCFLTHGEVKPAEALAAALQQRLNWQVTIPEYEQTIELT